MSRARGKFLRVMGAIFAFSRGCYQSNQSLCIAFAPSLYSMDVGFFLDHRCTLSHQKTTGSFQYTLSNQSRNASPSIGSVSFPFRFDSSMI
jgi:hypothetical protein